MNIYAVFNVVAGSDEFNFNCFRLLDSLFILHLRIYIVFYPLIIFICLKPRPEK